MKKKILGLFLVLTLLLTACGNSKTGNTLTPPEPGPTEAPLSDTDEARAKRAEDVRTANTIAAAVQTALQDKRILDSIQNLDVRTFDIEQPKATNGDDENPSIAFAYIDKEMCDGLSLLTEEVSLSLGKKSPEIKYTDENWNPTVWRIWVKTDNSVEVVLVDTGKEGASGLRTLYPVVDPSYQ